MMTKAKSGVVIFAYHNMGVMGLRTLIVENINIHLVVTHRDNLKENIWFESVSELCIYEKINYIYSEDYSIDEINEITAKLNISVIFSFYYRKILPDSILQKAQHGAVNMHGSYLPKYRGRVPVNWQIINGERQSGVTLHYMVDKPDEGDIIDQIKVGISFDDTPLTLFAKLETGGKKILTRSLFKILNGTCKRTPQDNSIATYYGGRKPEDGRIDWSWSSEKIYNLIRGVTKPYPGAFSFIKEKKIIVWKAFINNSLEINNDFIPGAILINHDQVNIRTGDGFIKLNEIQINDDIYTDLKSINLFQSVNGFISD